jgi:hypothetical protein
MSKFLLNLLVQIFKALIYSKIKFYSEIIFFSDSGPTGPAPAASPAGRRERTRPTRPEQPWRTCQKAPLLRVCAVRQRCFLSRRCQLGPTRQIHLLPRAGRPEARLSPRLPTSIIVTPIKAPYSPALIPPLESPLTPPPAINGVGHKSPAVTHRHFHPEHPRPPIKGEHPPPSFTAPLPASFPLSPHLSSTLTEHRRR